MSYKNEAARLAAQTRYTFEDLVKITQILRSEEGCPWDREQDHHSVRVCLIEETYEVAEAIDKEDAVLLREELGDLLFQVLFHAQIEAEKETFDMLDVISDIAEKMVHRHPHVFGSLQVESSSEVLQNWESIKTEEKQRNTLAEKLRAIPPMMPALMRAQKVGKKVGRTSGVSPMEQLSRIEEELRAVRESITSGADADVGGLLMSVTDLARVLDQDAEHALMRETERVIDAVSAQNALKN